MKRIFNDCTLPTGKADRFYIMLDRKGIDIALAKVGISQDTLKSRLHAYRTSNPLLKLVAVCEIRKNYDLKTVEEMFFDYFRQVKGYEHAFGEWVIINNEDEINALEELGFKFFGNLFYRIKNNSFYREEVRKLWSYNQR